MIQQLEIQPLDRLSFGYCTNVHAGATLATAQENLARYATAVQKKITPNAALPIGLWISSTTTESLRGAEQIAAFKEWLATHRLLPYTFNGFPQGDFHQPVVKHDVYRPTWRDQERLDYTCTLADILSGLLDPNTTGSISTLPLGWPHEHWDDSHLQAAGRHLLDCARRLQDIEQNTGVHLVIAIEPEPGCVLNTAPEMVDFFERYLFASPDANLARRHLSICHDICHSGVMFEGQEVALNLYRNSGIRVGKVQVSSAVHVPWDSCINRPEAQAAIAEQLTTLNEPKYLHQTTRCDSNGQLQELCEDLPVALNDWLASSSLPTHAWRIHFHVPIFVEQFGSLQTTRGDIETVIRFLDVHSNNTIDGAPWFTGHYEVETYAWPVLPAELAASDLASGIAHELEYFHRLLKS